MLVKLLSKYYRSGVRGSSRLTLAIDRFYSLKDIEVPTPYGKVFVDLTATAGQWIAAFQGSREGDIIRQHAQGVCYDIGANFGIYSVLMAQRCQVFAFEPNPRIVPYLRKTASNELHHFNVIDVALSDVPGAAELFVPEDESMASLVDWMHDEDMWGLWKSAGHVSPVNCVVTTLDEYVAEHRLPLPNFIKIDVEGGEVKVLRGGRKTIEASRPTIFFETTEVLWRKHGTTHEEAFDFFRSLGYRLFKGQTELKDLNLNWDNALAIADR